MYTGQGSVPRYVQLAAIIRKEIISGSLKPGDQVPSEPELTLRYSVSKTTAARALDLLAAEQLITRRTGSGSYVTETGQVPQVLKVRVGPGTRVTARPTMPGDPGPPGVPVLIVERPERPAEEYPADRSVILFES